MTDGAVRKTVTVNSSADQAFKVFTEGFDSWWPRSHKIGEADLKQAVIEGKEGGRWYEIDIDGNECEWGRVLVWDPPRRLVLAWQLDASWHFDPNLLTEVEVTFVPEGPDRARVELEHRNLERFGEAQEQMRSEFGSEGGWAGLLEGYARTVGA
ncbi:MAG TPA: SRPBCC family protein [Acidimicrobiales bacterium]|nr:SRPBCC family protein [Acidimicrobiales bacterium]